MSQLSLKNVPEEKAVRFLLTLTLLMQEIQIEISKALVKEDAIRKKIEKSIKQPDHKIIEEMSKAVRQLVLMMPLATHYGLNLPMNVLEMHSVVTGDKTLNNLLKKVVAKLDSIQLN